jgi:hypothetical protein
MGEGIRNFRDSLKGDQTPKSDPPKGDDESKNR